MRPAMRGNLKPRVSFLDHEADVIDAVDVLLIVTTILITSRRSDVFADA